MFDHLCPAMSQKPITTQILVTSLASDKIVVLRAGDVMENSVLFSSERSISTSQVRPHDPVTAPL